MRELKFRIWDKQNKNFVKEPTKYKSLAISCDGRGVYIGHYDDCDVEDRYFIQQYTGLKDKNGKEIYEGDILSGVCIQHRHTVICIVELDILIGIRYKAVKLNCNRCKYAMLRHTYTEIIGNIFENPELLKKN